MTAHQSLPDPAADLTDFPAFTLGAGIETFRAHSVTRGAWWFDNGVGGRFNLHGDRGTCYTATDVETAVRERVRDEVTSTGVVSKAFADSFTVSVVTAPVSYRCADVTAKRAQRHRVVRELCTMENYTVPQAWADAFDNAGFDGFFYGSAYTTGPANAYALFGDAGAAPSGAGFTEHHHMTGAAACAEAGLRVDTPPAASAFVLV